MKLLDRGGRIAIGAAVLIAVWGGLVPFVGPLFNYQMGPDGAWVVTESRITLHAIPAVAIVVAGLALLFGSSRRGGTVLGTVVLAGGAWFVLGPVFHPLWDSGGGGGMMGSEAERALRQLGYHYGTGLLIAGLAAYALGRLAPSREAAVEEAAPVERGKRADRRRPRRGAPVRT